MLGIDSTVLQTEEPMMAGGEVGEDPRIDDEIGRGHGLRVAGSGSLWPGVPLSSQELLGL